MTMEENRLCRELSRLGINPTEVFEKGLSLDFLEQMDGYQVLANAIIWRAAEDFESARKKLDVAIKKHRRKQVLDKLGKILDEIRDFYNSEWYVFLSGEANDIVCNRLESCFNGY